MALELTRLLLLDPDPGLRYCISDPKGFINQAYDQNVLPGVSAAIDQYVAEGWQPFAITNQGGIGSGKMTLEEGTAIQHYLMKLLPQLQGTLFCPSMDGTECYWATPDGGCEPVHTIERFKTWNFRQPAGGMIDVLKAFYFPDEMLVVGSRKEDADSARAAKEPYKTVTEWLASCGIALERADVAR